MSTRSVAKISDVDIDADGVFKYILIKIKDKDGVSKMIVRGYSWAQYHGNTYALAARNLYSRLGILDIMILRFYSVL